MPCLKIMTNIPMTKIPRDFVDKIIPTLAKTLNKPADKFLCIICGDCHLSFGGDSSNTGCVATLESIGNLGPEENKIITRELSKVIEKELKIHPARFFLTFYDLTTYNVGIKGTTIQDSLK